MLMAVVILGVACGLQSLKASAPLAPDYEETVLCSVAGCYHYEFI